MTVSKTLLASMTALVVVMLTLSGCDSPAPEVALPEVNDENCKHENIVKLDKSVQKEFSSLCLRRGDFVPSKPKTW